MLSTAHNFYNGSDIPGLYKSALIYHPCNKWVQALDWNYYWLYRCWDTLIEEWKIRWNHLEDGKRHDSERMGEIFKTAPVGIPTSSKFDFVTPFYPIAIVNKSCIVEGDAVESYRNYYRVDKRRFATWRCNRKPEWF